MTDRTTDSSVVAALVDNHRQFLAFLQRRVATRAEAEDILQSAYVRGLERGGAIRTTESAVAWFYRLLRNALADHYRRKGVRERVLSSELSEDFASADAEMQGEICACIGRLLPTLKPEYAEMIRRVDLEQKPLSGVAAALGVTANNASVRLHRARAALRRSLQRSCGTCATHGCLDCGCSSAARNTSH